MQVSAIYTTFMGESSKYGIGAPVHFLRLQGCHLRCYKATLGILCDTPEGLSAQGGRTMTTNDIITKLDKLREDSGGVNLVCLSGGDPLWRLPVQLHELFVALRHAGYNVVVETSGTLSMRDYRHYANVTWVLDYKVASAGIKNKQANTLLRDVELLNEDDVIKFVLYDENDYLEFIAKFIKLDELNCNAKIVVGAYWGGKLTTFQIVQRLIGDKLFGRVAVNMQAHKALLREIDTVNPMYT